MTVEKKTDITVLLTGCGAPGAPGIIRCLRSVDERNIRIVGVDCDENASGRSLVDQFHVVPRAGDDGFVSAIVELCEKEHVDVLEPIVTRELLKLSTAKRQIEAIGTKVAVMDAGPLSVANNKARLLETLEKAGFPTPSFVVVNSVSEMKSAFEQLGYPEKALCVKGAEGNGSRGVRIIDPHACRYDAFFNEKPNGMYISYNELVSILSERPAIPEMIVMENLPGYEYGVDVLCDSGDVVFMAGRRNSIVKSSIPLESIIESNEDAFSQVKRMVSIINIDGHCNFDFKENEDGQLRIIELNPRLSASIVAYKAAGVNFPYLGIKRLLDEPIPPINCIEGVIMRKQYRELFYDGRGNQIEW